MANDTDESSHGMDPRATHHPASITSPSHPDHSAIDYPGKAQYVAREKHAEAMFPNSQGTPAPPLPATGHMQFNPQATLNTSQVKDKRPAYQRSETSGEVDGGHHPAQNIPPKMGTARARVAQASTMKTSNDRMAEYGHAHPVQRKPRPTPGSAAGKYR